AIFCLLGWGDDCQHLSPDSMEYELLDAYLSSGGKMYLECDVAWDPQDLFWGKFATHAPLDYLTRIDDLATFQNGHNYIWGYDEAADPYTQILVPYTPEAEVLITSRNTDHLDQTVAILNETSSYSTVASSFSLADVDDSPPYSSDFPFLLGVILDRLGVISFIPVAADDSQISVPTLSAGIFPNPFSVVTTLRFELPKAAPVRLEIFNLRGQKVRSFNQTSLTAGSHELLWDGCDHNLQSVAPGIYLWQLRAGDKSLHGKMLKLAE
nr:T9SS type A sorting domain-containing protein [Candidatus Cloacimonadota bacterium]